MESNKERIIIVGGGSLAIELISWILNSDIFDNIEKRLFFIDDFISEDINLDSIKVKFLGKIKDIIPKDDDKFYLGIANPLKKSEIVKILDEKKVNFCTFIHPSAIISNTTKIGKGCVIFPFSICSSNSNLQNFITINVHTAVGHDVGIGPFTTLSSFVDVTGKVQLGEKVMVGSGARFLPSIKIGDNCTIGAGATVYHSVPNGKTAYCKPAKLI
ncbi:acetyltransferase [uncultured Prochlorococcus sp.]|uniref:acetyltransferase n=1 Tax=uncultured Prochlorococcus sp. TaxID=159733 RepID=UPI002585C763|nr:acetyltransferase [uncultured Prochlorococcus sp.]